MKRLNSIKCVSFKEDAVFLEQIPIVVGIDVEEWLAKFCDIPYELQNYSHLYPKSTRIKFENYESGISIYLNDKIIESVDIFPRCWASDSRCYHGDIFIFDKKLDIPFLSDDIEKYFPNIEIKPKGYWERFTPHESVCCSVNNDMKIEISMSRLPKLVGSISLKSI